MHAIKPLWPSDNSTSSLKNISLYLTLLILFLKSTQSTALNTDIQDSGFKADSIPKETNRHFSPPKAWLLSGASIVSYTSTILVLDKMWYQGFPRSRFHFYDDLSHWQYMDKMGHAATAYHLSRLGHKAWEWTGIDDNKTVWLGGSMGAVFLTTIEILDGFSTQWGASPSDLTANTLGSALFVSQQLIWKEQKVLLKYSYHNSGLAQYRPDLLGETLPEKMLKDYNGQTYWLSASLKHFCSSCPPWLGISVGYGAKGMTGAKSNPLTYNNHSLPLFERTKSFYLAPDIILSKTSTKSPLLKNIFLGLDFIKFPSPAIEIDSNGRIYWHLLFF